ncbi:MAG: hypothetical protein LBT30_00050 [Clostridiales bacterium]|jgi:uncharacterized protein with PIN domain|nr:hypothetical protein [Clostridiales bacterium]
MSKNDLILALTKKFPNSQVLTLVNIGACYESSICPQCGGEIWKVVYQPWVLLETCYICVKCGRMNY